MSVFLTYITKLSQNFLHSDPFKYDEYLAITPTYQKYCLKGNLPTRFTITLAKEAMLIHDIAIHLLAGGVKLTIGVVKGICAIASGILGIETDHQTPSKQAAVHIGFACIYAIDLFVSITNINKTYPQHLVDKIKNTFIKFLKVHNKEITIEYLADPNLEEQLRVTQEELKIRDADLDQLEQDIERTAQNLNEPSQCELIVNEALNPDTSIILEKVRSITKNNREQLKTTHTAKPKVTIWFESESGINEIINSLTLNGESPLPPYDSQNYLSMDPDHLLEESFIRRETIEETLRNNPFEGQTLKEEKRPIEKLSLENESVISEREEINPQKNIPVTRRPKRKTSSHSNPLQTSAFAIRNEYSKNLRNRRKKPQLANSQNK